MVRCRRLHQDQIPANFGNLVGDQVVDKIDTLLNVQQLLRMSMESQRQRATVAGGKIRG